VRILQLHCDSIEYTPTKKEIKSAEEITPETKKFQEIVVAFVAIEEGDDSSVAKKAMDEISESMNKVGCKKLLLYPYAHLSSNLASPSTALSILKQMESSATNLEVSRAPFGWTKSYKVHVKGHPLAENSKVITKGDVEEISEQVSIALESEQKIKSFWHILSPDGKMTKLSNFDFKNHQNLEVLAKYETAKKRSVDEPPAHVSLMKKLAMHQTLVTCGFIQMAD